MTRTIFQTEDSLRDIVVRQTLVLSIALAGILACGGLAAEERERIGHAFDRNSGALLYQERHTETYANGEMTADTVQYIDPQGHIFGQKQVDFSRDPFVPEFQLDNTRTGHVEGLTRIAVDSLQVRFREHADEALRQQQLDLPRDAIADAGFDRFIESQWGHLIAGKTLVRKFLVPSRLEFMDWRIRRSDNVREDTPHDAKRGDQRARRTVRFALEIDSAFLRLVVPPIVVIYDRDTRRLMRYEGLSNLRDDSGENHSVRIEFEYLEQQASNTDTQTLAQWVGLESTVNGANAIAPTQSRQRNREIANTASSSRRGQSRLVIKPGPGLFQL